MTHGREKRLLLGALALLAPLPLPFNEVIGWATFGLFAAAMLLFLHRARRGSASWLSFRAMNVLGLAYLPFLFADVTVLWRGRPLPPLVHLAMFALVVKLFGLQRERDKWHAVFGAFFLFLAAMGSSVHPTVVLYLLGWSALGLYTLIRFAALELFTRHLPREAAPPVRLAGFLAGGIGFMVAVAVPLFLSMPRLRTPYVLVPVGAPGAIGRVTGLEEDLSLDFIGRIRLDRSVALRARYDAVAPLEHELRFKAGAYDRFDGRVWKGRRRRGSTLEGTPVQRGSEGLFRVAPGRLVGWMEIWLEPLEGAVLPMPVGGVGLDFPQGLQIPALTVDREGVVSLYARPREGINYRAALSDGTPLAIPAAGARRAPALPSVEPDPADRELAGVTPRIRELADEVAGAGGDLERAQRLERHLATEYDYTLDYLGGRGDNRVEDFLFTHRRGHCELFASAMVLMLRAEGIPARLVSGFLGGDYNPIEGYYVVRQSNAHAWVEAWVGEDEPRWTTFDPTPPDGRPQAGDGGLLALAAQLYDFVVFRWDRYVLTYGFMDQVGTLLGFRDLWADLARWFSRQQASPVPGATSEASPEPGVAAPPPAAGESPAGWVSLAAVLALLAVWTWQRRQRFSAVLAYRQLRDQLAGEPDRSPETLAPLEVSRRLAERFPRSAEPIGRIVSLYLEESFGERTLTAGEREELREAIRQAHRAPRASAA